MKEPRKVKETIYGYFYCGLVLVFSRGFHSLLSWLSCVHTPTKNFEKRKEKRKQSLAECADRECLTCAQRRGSEGGGGGGGWYWQALFAVQIFALVASLAFAHRVMGGVTA